MESDTGIVIEFYGVVVQDVVRARMGARSGTGTELDSMTPVRGYIIICDVIISISS